MNREIKFRVWNRLCGRYHDADFIISNDGLVNLLDGGWNLDGCFFDGSEVALEQFTGLTDKNGVDIYEGGILRAKDDRFPAKVIFDTSSLSWVAEIYLRGEPTKKIPLKQYILQREKAVNADCLVVGNTHENPEMLNSNEG